MAEAARRFQSAGSPDLVRRMIARPVRQAHQSRTRLLEIEPAPMASRGGDEGLIARLETELQVMKAVVRVQRKEVESLRAQRQLLTDSSPHDDVRATRERWAALVDGLIAYGR